MTRICAVPAELVKADIWRAVQDFAERVPALKTHPEKVKQGGEDHGEGEEREQFRVCRERHAPTPKRL